MQYVIPMIFLIPCSIHDIRTRSVPMVWLVIGGACAVLVGGSRVYLGTTSVWNLLVALSPGALLLALSWLTRQQIGYGDGIAVSILGIMLGSPGIYLALMLALVLSSLWSIGILATRRGNRHTQLPWLPFLAAGVVITALIGGGAM